MSAASAAPAPSSAATPFWATSRGVHLIAGLYFLIFAVIAITLHSSLGADDAAENYNVQSLAISYTPRNPPLYDWILFLLQRVLGTGPAGFAVLNYGAICACVLVFYRVARRVIGDPRLQALATFAFSLLWDIGHEAHRILTHSNLMIVAIAATVLILLHLAERATLWRYALLGIVMALGVLSKFGYLAFIGTALPAALIVPAYRRVLIDRRILVTLVIAAVPLAVFYALTLSLNQSIVGEVAGYISVGRDASFGGRLIALGRAYFGYIIPLVPVALAVFFIRPKRANREPSPGQSDFRRFAFYQLAFGTLVAVVWILVLGSTQVKPRYFHALLLMTPVFLFCVVELFVWTRRQTMIFLGLAIFSASAIIVEQAGPRFLPSEALCGQCRPSTPYAQLGPLVEARLGPAPTLVTSIRTAAGFMRAAVPGARIVVLVDSPYRPPPRPTDTCALIWDEDTQAEGARRIASAVAANPGEIEDIVVPWFQPWLSVQRTTRWHMLRLDPGSELCR